MRDLLGLLTREAGCTYLSDLPSVYKHTLHSTFIQALAAEDYSLEEWNDALTYLTRVPVNCLTQQQAKEYLLCKLST